MYKNNNSGKKELAWKVFEESTNDKEIRVINIFDHWRLKEKLFEAKKAAIKSLKPYGKIEEMEDDNPHLLEVKETFIKEVDGWLMYYYWGKCEHEIILTSWPSYITKEELEKINQESSVKFRAAINLEVERKVDVYEQIMINKDAFFDYLWRNIDLIKKVSRI